MFIAAALMNASGLKRRRWCNGSVASGWTVAIIIPTADLTWWVGVMYRELADRQSLSLEFLPQCGPFRRNHKKVE